MRESLPEANSVSRRGFYRFFRLEYLALLGIIVGAALWDSGWHPTNVFLVVIAFMLTPGALMGASRMWTNRENIKNIYEQSRLMFTALKLERKRKKEESRKGEEKAL